MMAFVFSEDPEALFIQPDNRQPATTIKTYLDVRSFFSDYCSFGKANCFKNLEYHHHQTYS